METRTEETFSGSLKFFFSVFSFLLYKFLYSTLACLGFLPSAGLDISFGFIF